MDNSSHTIEYVLLAGGQGSRMGIVDKGMLRKGESTFAEILMSRFLAHEDARVIVSANSEVYAELASVPGVRIIRDNYRGTGPLGGIEAAMSASECEFLLFCPCDMPNADGILELLEGVAAGLDDDIDAIVVCCNGRTYPTLGIYRRRVLGEVREQLDEGNYRLMSLLEKLRVEMLDIPPRIGAVELANINTPEDYDRL